MGKKIEFEEDTGELDIADYRCDHTPRLVLIFGCPLALCALLLSLQNHSDAEVH